MKGWPPGFVARVKAALFLGIPPKVISRLTEVPVGTLREWKRAGTRAAIEPEQSLIEEVKLALRKEN